MTAKSRSSVAESRSRVRGRPSNFETLGSEMPMRAPISLKLTSYQIARNDTSNWRNMTLRGKSSARHPETSVTL